jgi:glycosyltransferase involved in cell wall biosynthesis
LKANAGPRIKFLGHVGDQDHVKELHCNAYAYLHGHSMGGTNPSLLKALGCGNCIVAFNVPFNTEVLRDGQGTMYGVMFDDADDLLRQLQMLEAHPEFAEELRKRAPDRIRNVYSWPKIIDAYEKLFLAAAASKHPIEEKPGGERFFAWS